jgi:hypothetical protein
MPLGVWTKLARVFVAEASSLVTAKGVPLDAVQVREVPDPVTVTVGLV